MEWGPVILQSQEDPAPHPGLQSRYLLGTGLKPAAQGLVQFCSHVLHTPLPLPTPDAQTGHSRVPTAHMEVGGGLL